MNEPGRSVSEGGIVENTEGCIEEREHKFDTTARTAAFNRTCKCPDRMCGNTLGGLYLDVPSCRRRRSRDELHLHGRYARRAQYTGSRYEQQQTGS
jgi:hypothetical protein